MQTYRESKRQTGTGTYINTERCRKRHIQTHRQTGT